jgi:hypothetical protein
MIVNRNGSSWDEKDFGLKGRKEYEFELLIFLEFDSK